MRFVFLFFARLLSAFNKTRLSIRNNCIPYFSLRIDKNHLINSFKRKTKRIKWKIKNPKHKRCYWFHLVTI